MVTINESSKDIIKIIASSMLTIDLDAIGYSFHAIARMSPECDWDDMVIMERVDALGYTIEDGCADAVINKIRAHYRRKFMSVLDQLPIRRDA